MAAFSKSWVIDSAGIQVDASIPVTDRALRYGMSVFETVAWTGRRLVFLDEHLVALCSAAEAAEVPWPEMMTAEIWAKLVRDLPAEAGVLRIYLTSGDGLPLAPVVEPRVFVLFETTHFPTTDEVAEGYILQTSAAPIPCILGGWKTGNYWSHIQALSEANRAGAQEALVFNAMGALVSASMANVFLVKGGLVRTPAPVTGARRGIVRSWILSQLPVDEALLTLEDVMMADECFITNSRLGVMPVVAIDGRLLPKRESGDRLSACYREQILGA